MAKVVHLYCRHCGVAMQNSSRPYCPPCNLELCYKAMPILLGMMMTSQLAPRKAEVAATAASCCGRSRWRGYPHLKDIMD